jgi:hypothetical protein
MARIPGFDQLEFTGWPECLLQGINICTITGCFWPDAAGWLSRNRSFGNSDRLCRPSDRH